MASARVWGAHATGGGMAADAEGNDAQASQVAVRLENTAEGVLQPQAVVDARTHDDLAVDRHAGVQQQAQPAQARGPPPVAQHLGAQFGIGGVDADEQRRQTLGDDPLEVGLGEPGERREVPVQERQPVVVVLEIEAGAHPRRQLVDEAELAVVVAGAHLIEQGGVNLEAQRGAGSLVDLDVELQAAAVNLYFHLRFIHQAAILQNVARRDAVQ